MKRKWTGLSLLFCLFLMSVSCAPVKMRSQHVMRSQLSSPLPTPRVEPPVEPPYDPTFKFCNPDYETFPGEVLTPEKCDPIPGCASFAGLLENRCFLVL